MLSCVAMDPCSPPNIPHLPNHPPCGPDSLSLRRWLQGMQSTPLSFVKVSVLASLGRCSIVLSTFKGMLSFKIRELVVCTHCRRTQSHPSPRLSLFSSSGVQVVQGQVSQSVCSCYHGDGGLFLRGSVPSGGFPGFNPGLPSHAALFLLLHPHTLVCAVLLLPLLPLLPLLLTQTLVYAVLHLLLVIRGMTVVVVCVCVCMCVCLFVLLLLCDHFNCITQCHNNLLL